MIVLEELFDQAQEVLKSRTTAPRGRSFHYNPDNLLRNKIICGGCGISVATGMNKKGLFYHCKTKVHNRCPECASQIIHASVIMEVILRSLNLQIDACIEKAMHQKTQPDIKLELLKAEENSVLQSIDRLKGHKIASYEKYREGILLKEFLCTKCDFTNEFHEMYNRLDIVCKKTQQVEEEISQKRQLLEMKDMAGTLQEVDQRVIDLFVKKVEIYANRCIKIRWNFSDLFGN